MSIKRRQFIKQSFGAVGMGLLLPDSFFARSLNEAITPDPARKVLVIIELAGGNDGLNTVIPYTDPRYASLRPTLSFKEPELRDSRGRSTVISDRFGFHPSMGRIKDLYDAGKVAAVLGVGYPNPNGSHFVSAEIWHTGNVQSEGRGEGWLGRYADVELAGKPGLSAIAIEDQLPKTFASTNLVIPSTPSFDNYGLQTDPDYPENRNVKINTLLSLQRRSFPGRSFAAPEARIGFDAVNGALQFRQALQEYRSTVEYPDNNGLADGLRMLAQVITTIPETSLLYVQMGGFDNHSDQIAGASNKLQGSHANLLGDFADGVYAFYNDLSEHGLADNVIILQWSEFGRRPEENRSLGTDHGAASCIFVIGNPVRGGLYGEQPSLAATDLDDAGNLQFHVDFRSVYGTILDRWLGTDSRAVLGAKFENAGFLG
jgi:uncharacterized protein (DUF1501 family)